MDYEGNSSTVTGGRLSGFGGAPNMGNSTGGRRHTTKSMARYGSAYRFHGLGRKLVVQMTKSQSKYGPAFVPELDAVKIGRKRVWMRLPSWSMARILTHVVTEQGIAYLYQAQNAEERTKMLGCIAQGTPVGSMVGIGEIERTRREGKVAYPQDLPFHLMRQSGNS